MKTSGAAMGFIVVETPVARTGIAPTHFTIWITHLTALPSVCRSAPAGFRLASIREIPRTVARLLGTHAFSQETQLPLGPQSHQV